MHSTPFVIDLGTHTTRVGWAKGASETAPNKPTCIRTILGTGNTDGVSSSSSVYVGYDAEGKKDTLDLSEPLSHGFVQNWEEVNTFISLIIKDHYAEQFSTNPPNVVVLEPALSPNTHKQSLSQLFFEKHRIPSLCFAETGSMVLRARHITSGLAVELGDGLARVIPVIDNITQRNNIRLARLAGHDITSFLTKLLEDSGYSFCSSNDHEIVRNIKERVGYVSLDPSKDLLSPKLFKYKLPESHEITVGKEAFLCTESLFQPHLVQMRMHGLHFHCFEAIRKCEEKHQENLFQHIVLSGGSAQFDGLSERLKNEIVKLRVQAARRKNQTGGDYKDKQSMYSSQTLYTQNTESQQIDTSSSSSSSSSPSPQSKATHSPATQSISTLTVSKQPNVNVILGGPHSGWMGAAQYAVSEEAVYVTKAEFEEKGVSVFAPKC